jgi:TPR repeat protein
MVWLAKAAGQGYAPAEVELGRMYVSGQNGPPNAKEALRWYRKAAKSGNMAAELALGLAYLHGTGVPEDSHQAMRWLERAAQHGSTAAAQLLKAARTSAEPSAASFVVLSEHSAANSDQSNRP